MFPMISNRQYRLDRIRHERKCPLGMAVLLLALMAGPASAQQLPADPRVETYRQLLSEANDRVVNMASQSHQLQQQVQQLQAELAKLKAPKEEPKK
jgi:septal ring factor EnvC (AmiA/AmiB activator)